MTLSQSDVAKAFTEKREAKCEHLYTNGETIYSYGEHFPIATWSKNKSGKEFIFFNYSNYSNSTAKQQRIVFGEISNEHIPTIGINGKDFSTEGMNKEIEESLKIINNKRIRNFWRKTYVKGHIDDIINIFPELITKEIELLNLFNIGGKNEPI